MDDGLRSALLAPRDLDERYAAWGRLRQQTGPVSLDRGLSLLALSYRDVQSVLGAASVWAVVPEGVDGIVYDGQMREIVAGWWRADVRWRLSEVVSTVTRDVLRSHDRGEIDLVSDLVVPVVSVVSSWMLADSAVSGLGLSRYPDEFLMDALGGANLSAERFDLMRSVLSASVMDVVAGSLINGGMTLLQRRAHWERLGLHPDGVGIVVREALRLYCPLLGVTRSARHSTRLGVVQIATGTRIFVGVASALRDPALFDDPDSFRPGRVWRAGWRGHEVGTLPWLALQLGGEALAAMLLVLVQAKPSMALVRSNDWSVSDFPFSNTLRSLRVDVG